MNFKGTIQSALALTAAVVLTGCGGASTKQESTSAGLLQVDGKIIKAEETFEVDPNAEGDNIVFAYGPKVQRGVVQALAASGEVARVYYQPTTKAPVAAAVRQAPEFADDVVNYTGSIESVNSSAIVIDGNDGKRTFDISAAEADAFDIPHLKEHQAEGSQVKVYYRQGDDVLSGIAYEDA